MSNEKIVQEELSDLLNPVEDVYSKLYWWTKKELEKGFKIPVSKENFTFKNSTTLVLTKDIWSFLEFKKLKFSYLISSLVNYTSNFPIEEQFPNFLIFDLDDLEINFYNKNILITKDPGYNFLDNYPQYLNLSVQEHFIDDMMVEIKLKNSAKPHRSMLENYLADKRKRLNIINERILYGFRLVLSQTSLKKELVDFGIKEVENLTNDKVWEFFNNLKSLPLVGQDIQEQFMYLDKLVRKNNFNLSFNDYKALIIKVIAP